MGCKREKGKLGMIQIKINEANGTTVVVKKEDNFYTVGEYINYLIVPALLGLGFSDKLIGKHIVSDILDTQPD
jgi:hypothetical protein